MRATFITLAIDDGADPDVLETRVTHTRKSRSAFDGYNRGLHWERTCAEVLKLPSTGAAGVRRPSCRSRPVLHTIRCISLHSSQTGEVAAKIWPVSVWDLDAATRGDVATGRLVAGRGGPS
jgi:hypothetical protein